jgi:hypothetical protein
MLRSFEKRSLNNDGRATPYALIIDKDQKGTGNSVGAEMGQPRGQRDRPRDRECHQAVSGNPAGL